MAKHIFANRSTSAECLTGKVISGPYIAGVQRSANMLLLIDIGTGYFEMIGISMTIAEKVRKFNGQVTPLI